MINLLLKVQLVTVEEGPYFCRARDWVGYIITGLWRPSSPNEAESPEVIRSRKDIGPCLMHEKVDERTLGASTLKRLGLAAVFRAGGKHSEELSDQLEQWETR